MRILKPLRVVKLFKAIKLIGVLKEELAIVLGLTLVKVMVLFGYLASSVHFCACGYWRAKLESNTKEEIADFLGTRHADPEVRRRARRASAELCRAASAALTPARPVRRPSATSMYVPSQAARRRLALMMPFARAAAGSVSESGCRQLVCVYFVLTIFMTVGFGTPRAE
jgi:hypothetical protein